MNHFFLDFFFNLRGSNITFSSLAMFTSQDVKKDLAAQFPGLKDNILSNMAKKVNNDQHHSQEKE